MKRMHLLLILLCAVLLCGHAAADWTCGICSYSWPYTMAYCDECGCDAPLSSLTVTAAGGDSVSLSWEGSAEVYTLLYTRAGSDHWTILGSTREHTYQITGLRPGETYQLAVAAELGNVLTVTASTTGQAAADNHSGAPEKKEGAAASGVRAAATPIPGAPAVGSVMTFGHYPQNAAGSDRAAISWQVLQVEGDRALLISRDGLDAMPYNDTETDVTWETCSLRKWLNGAFMNQAFTAREQDRIITTKVDNSLSQHYAGFGLSCGDTMDRIFLLSYAEAMQLLDARDTDEPGARDNVKARTHATDYAVSHHAYVDNGNLTGNGSTSAMWWLRSPGPDGAKALGVDSDGSLGYGTVTLDQMCVRPVMWVTLPLQ